MLFVCLQAGQKSVFLHGCTTAGCLKVWPPEDKEDVCESCGNTRFDEAGNPRDFVIWFSLKTRFTSLLCLPQYHEACKHEGKRRKNDGYMTGIYLFSVCSQHYNLFLYVYMFADIYDSPAWQEKMGPVVRRDDGEVCVTRLGLLFCTDGFPAFNQKRKGAISLLPAEFINLSHGPHIRYDPDNVMIYFLIPNHYSAETQRKYYKYVTKVELNPLQRDGVPGPDGPVKIKVFCASLDLKGKEKFYNQVAVGSYMGCTTCSVHFDEGPGGPIYALSRRYLPADHPLRSRTCLFKGYLFKFRNDETRNVPPIKTTQTMFKYAALAQQLGVEHYLGQKGFMMLSNYDGLQHEIFNTVEWMHNMARFYDNFMTFICPRDKKVDMRARKSSKILGVFPEIWIGQNAYLSEMRTRSLCSLTDHQINTGGKTWLCRWLRIGGTTFEQTDRVKDLRLKLISLRSRAQDGERIVLLGKLNPLPWRLTPAARQVVNNRALRVCYPHYTPLCSIDSDSFINGAGVWRTANKLLALMVLLVPLLRGYLPAVRLGLRSLIWGIRILEGQTISVNEADALHVERGSKVLREADTDRARTLIIEGLAMLEGCCPVACIVPAVHCLCHYADCAEQHGLLTKIWMMNFGQCFWNIHFLLNLLTKPFCCC